MADVKQSDKMTIRRAMHIWALAAAASLVLTGILTGNAVMAVVGSLVLLMAKLADIHSDVQNLLRDRDQ